MPEETRMLVAREYLRTLARNGGNVKKAMLAIRKKFGFKPRAVYNYIEELRKKSPKKCKPCTR